jgi:hypothetical protein
VYDIRYAAADALSAFVDIFSQGVFSFQTLDSPAIQTLKMVYLFLLYDCMNDDDEDIRNVAAKTASTFWRIVRPDSWFQARSCIPIFASTSIITTFLIDWDHGDTKFQQEALRRTTGAKRVIRDAGSNQIVIEPLSRQRLAEALVENDDLFRVERQNLYINDMRESCVWKKVLERQNIAPKYLLALRDWVLEGFQVLSEHIESNHDGPLGWTSKQETYSFVVEVINAARVLFFRARQDGHRVDIQVVTEALMQFYLQGQRGNLHPLLMEQMQRVIGRELTRTCGNVGKVVAAVSLRIHGARSKLQVSSA